MFLITLIFDCLLLEYRNAVDSYELILYPVILLNLFISSDTIMIESIDFFFP